MESVGVGMWKGVGKLIALFYRQEAGARGWD
jgi:hypothetical protein